MRLLVYQIIYAPWIKICFRVPYTLRCYLALQRIIWRNFLKNNQLNRGNSLGGFRRTNTRTTSQNRVTAPLYSGSQPMVPRTILGPDLAWNHYRWLNAHIDAKRHNYACSGRQRPLVCISKAISIISDRFGVGLVVFWLRSEIMWDTLAWREQM